MLQSKLFTKTRREAPKDETSKNAQLLIRGGYINKEMAGVYDFLPLGLRVLNKIIEIIRQEMNAIGGQEVLLSTLQNSSNWEKTGRWSDKEIDVWFKTKNKEGSDFGLAPTHEEPLTNLVREHLSSYKDLPFYIYQFQNKFRNELRAKSGIMRTREFIMKDLYSFSRNEEEFREFYEKCAESYLKIFKRVGLGEITYRTFASGGSFSKFSDEFQTVSPAGEDIIYIDDKKGIAINKEVYIDEVISELGLSKETLREEKSIEVGNIFPLSTRFSEALSLSYKNEAGEDISPVMGSYGIGPARLMGTIVEALSDEVGIIWPEEVAPFSYHIVALGDVGSEAHTEALNLYKEMGDMGAEVLFDDRDKKAGEKFADADLLGVPKRLVVSSKTLAEGKYELKERKSGDVSMISKEELLALLSKK